MSITIHSDSFLPFISAFVSMLMLTFFLAHRNKTPMLWSMIILYVITFLWAFGKGMELSSKNLSQQWFSSQIMHLAINYSGLAWLNFFLTYIHHRICFKIIRIAVIPLVLIHLSFVTNSYHHMYYTVYQYKHIEAGWLSALNLIITLSYVLVGVVLVVHYSSKQDKNIRNQTRLFVMAVFFPVFMGLLEYINTNIIRSSFPFHELTTPSFIVSIIFTNISIFRYTNFHIFPMALQTIFENMRESILVVDRNGNIINHNCSFSINFPELIDNKGKKCINAVVEYLKENGAMENEKIISGIWSSESNVSGELYIKDRYFYINICSIYSKGNELLGKIISLNDITEYRRAFDALILQDNYHLVMEKMQKIHDTLTNQSIDEMKLKSQLKDRELSVIEYIVKGKSNKEIAAFLHLSEGRVKNIVTELLGKLHLESRTQLAIFALKYNLLKESVDDDDKKMHHL